MTSPVSPKAPYSEMVIQPGDEEIFKSFEKCLNLRDDYLKSSFQCPGDNPTNTKPREWRADPPVLLTAADSLSLTTATGKLTTTSKHPISMYQSTLSLPNSLSNTDDQMTASVMSVDGASSLKQSHLQGGASTLTTSVNIGKTYILSTYDLDACYIPGPSSMSYKLSDDGVYTLYHSAETKEEEIAYEVVSLKKYYQDLDYLVATIGHGPMKSFAYKRLKYLESLFNMYVLLNDAAEVKEQKVKAQNFYLSSYLFFNFSRWYLIVISIIFEKWIRTFIIPLV